MPQRARLLTIGHVTIDRTPEGSCLGGSCYYAAAVWQAAGMPARVFTSCGGDVDLRALPPHCEQWVVPSVQTTQFTNAYGPNGVTRRYLHARAESLEPAGLPASWREADVLFLAPVCGELKPEAWLATVRARVVGIGLQGLVRAVDASTGAVTPGPMGFDLRWVQGAWVFLGDEDLRETEREPAVQALLRAGAHVVRTHGERGSTVLSDGERWEVGIYPTEALDPTGAGDCYAAGFLLALGRGEGVEQAARYGAAVASLVVERRGTAGLARLEQARERARHVTCRRLETG